MLNDGTSTSEPPPAPSDAGAPPGAAWVAFVALAGIVTSLGAADVLPRWAGLVHAVAPPPLDLSFDLRLLVARADSYPEFVAGLVASVGIRSLLLATLMPALGIRLTLGSRLRRSLGFYLVASVPLGVGAALEFAGLASVYSWYAWAGLGLILVTALVMMPRWLAPRGGSTLLAVAGILGLGALAEAVSTEWIPAIVPLSAALTILVMSRRDRAQSRSSEAAAVGLSILLILPLQGPILAAKPKAPGAPVLFLVPGVDTATGEGAMYRFDPLAAGYDCAHVFYYSYRGPGGDQQGGEAMCTPIRLHEPYVKTDTQRPLAELVDAFARQIEAIRADTKNAPIAVVTHSQGAVIAWAALASGRVQGVTHLVALGGFPNSPMEYPPSNVDGEGKVGGDALRTLSAISRELGGGSFSPDRPFAREILARSDGLEDVFSQPLPAGVATTTLFSSFDTIAAPEGSRIPGVPGVTIDTTHVGMVEAPEASAVVRAFIAGERPSGKTFLARFLDKVVHAFMPPPTGS